MPYLVRPNLYIGDITDAANVLSSNEQQQQEEDRECNPPITHMLSVLSSANITFFTEWKPTLLLPSKEIQRVFVSDEEQDEELSRRFSKSALPKGKLVYSLEYAGKELKVKRMALQVKDTEDENLLDFLDVSLDFIDQGKNSDGGSVLVHCFAGVSRSAAIVTAYLMRSEGLTLEAALESLRQSCERVSPNDNFLEQLKMFEDMGFKVDRDCTIYKRFRLKILGDSYSRGVKMDSSKLGADPGLPGVAGLKTESSAGENTKPTVAYRCKKCRRVVALQDHIVEHKPGEGMTAFQWHKRSGGNSFNRPDEFGCSSIFVEPLKWMTAVEEGAMEGKLSCANCDARLGYFNWSGTQCNCGSWITPAFQLHKSKMDLSTI